MLTDSDSGTKTENRAEALRSDFKDIPHIDIQVTMESTFEKELVSENRSGDGKELLHNALCLTKPNNGPKFKNETGANDIDVEAFYAEIEHYKAEFAFNLVSTLEDEYQIAKNENRLPRKLAIPCYISKAFNFIRGL